MEKNEFEEFFQHLSSHFSEKEIAKILKPLKFQIQIFRLKKLLKILLIFAAICLAIYHIVSSFEAVNWFLCAVGRILMIKILPLWNWRYLGSAKCLIAKTLPAEREYRSSFNQKDCRVCEHFNQIDVISKISFGTINDKFLLRGLPVIVSDSLRNTPSSENLSHFIDNMATNMSDMLNSEPCNLETNLMLSKYATPDKAMRILRKSLKESEEISPWFITWRNCQLKALKASRLLTDKPYFYPTNFQAPYTSWLLISQKYENYRNELEVFGLVIITQIRGVLKLSLRVNENCQTICKNLSVKLFGGESLVFIANLWSLSYEFLANDDYDSFSVTFITETNL